MAVTGNRITALALNPPQTQLLRPPWELVRNAGQIRRCNYGALESAQVMQHPADGAWTLLPGFGDPAELVSETAGVSRFGTAIDDTQAELADNWSSVNTFKSPTDLPGVTPAGSVIASGAPAFVKRVPASGDFSAELDADVAAFPKPVLDPALIPMRRVLAGTVSYPENQGFYLFATLQRSPTDVDNWFTFYFGGQVETQPSTKMGGGFALTVRGNGDAILHELDENDDWVERTRFRWKVDAQQGMSFTLGLWIFPYGRNGLTIRTISTSVAQGGFTLLGLLDNLAALSVRKPTVESFGYLHSPTATGFIKPEFMTGPGVIRLDVREDLRPQIQITALRIPDEGTLVDQSFYIPTPLAAGTPIVVYGQTRIPRFTSMTVALYNAQTGAACTQTSTSPPTFSSISGVQGYRAVFTLLSSDPDDDDDEELHYQTPVLYGFKVKVAGSATTYNPGVTLSTGCSIRSVAITGADADPAHDSAQMVIEDPLDNLSQLRTRGGQRAQIRIYNSAGNTVRSVLFEGEIMRANAQLMGRAGTAGMWPNTAWRHYQLQFQGMWTRLQDATLTVLRDYGFDENAPAGGLRTWKITDAIADLLTHAGFTTSEYYIPDLGDIRFWSLPGNERSLILPPGSRIAENVARYAELLGLYLVWDANAGANGIWRAVYQPLPGGTPLTAFVFNEGSKIPFEGSDGATTVGVVDESFWSYVRKPEGNFVMVVGSGGTDPTGQPTACIAWMQNYISVGASSVPADIDYLERGFTPIVLVDPDLVGPYSVNWACRRLYDVACHGATIYRWQAPLVLLTPVQTGEAYQTLERPLRFGDTVTVEGVSMILRSVNPAYDGSDSVQLCDYEAIKVVR